MRKRYDAVVIGAGHNGLVAAAYLARAGLSVLVLERSDRAGGASVSAQIFNGFDARLSRYAYLVSLLPQKIVRDLQLGFTTRRRAVRDCAPIAQGGSHRALVRWSSDVERSRSSVESIAGPGDWDGLRRLSVLEHALAAMVWPSLLEPLRTRDEWVASLDGPDQAQAWRVFVEEPVGSVIERHVQSDVLRGALLTDAKIGLFTDAHDPSLLQNRCYVLHVVGQGTGEWQVPVGGMGALIDSLTNCAREAGVDILTGATVESVERGPVHGVRFARTDDGSHSDVEATRVLVNAGPQVFDALLGQDGCVSAQDEGSVCKVNMLLSKLPRLRSGVPAEIAFAGTFRVNESYSELAVAHREAQRSVPSAPPFELYCHTLTDSSILGADLRNRGFHTLTLFGLDAPYRLFASEGPVKEEFLRRYFAALDRHLLDPIEECLAISRDGSPCVEVKSPRDLEAELALNRGNIFHRAPGWFFADEPTAAGTWGVETQFERVYRCGASAQRGGGVSGIPGHNAAMRIFAELGISPPAGPSAAG